MPRIAKKLVDPSTLGPGGRALWDDTMADYEELDSRQQVLLLEACRMKDRLDRLDALLRGDVEVWLKLRHGRTGTIELDIAPALAQANTTTNIMKQTIAAMRLPDADGKRTPQARTAGVYVKGSEKVSSLDRARQRAGA